MNNHATSASLLFEGGWRSKDRNWMKDEYRLTDDEVDILCRHLQKLEEIKREWGVE